MKKFFVLILSFVYLTSSVGATVHLHYCMDKLVAWSFSGEDKKCDSCGMEKETDGCCKDEQKQVKLEADQKAPHVLNLLADPLHIATVETFYFTDRPAIAASALYLVPESHAPPLLPSTPVYLFNCTFRI